MMPELMAVCRPRPSALAGKTRGPAKTGNDGLRKAQAVGCLLIGVRPLPLRRKARSVVIRYRATAGTSHEVDESGCLVAPEGTQKQNSDLLLGRSLPAHHPRNRLEEISRMDGVAAAVEYLPHDGELTWLYGKDADKARAEKPLKDRYDECVDLCRRLEKFWRAKGHKDVKCVPQAKRYRGRRVDGEKFTATYWEVSSNISPRWRA